MIASPLVAAAASVSSIRFGRAFDLHFPRLSSGTVLVIEKDKTKKHNLMAKYGKTAQKKVKRAMHERKEGTLRSGGSGKKVTSRKQAIAIGLSEARAAGAKVPKKVAKKSPKKTAKKSAKKSGRASAAKKTRKRGSSS